MGAAENESYPRAVYGPNGESKIIYSESEWPQGYISGDERGGMVPPGTTARRFGWPVEGAPVKDEPDAPGRPLIPAPRPPRKRKAK